MLHGRRQFVPCKPFFTEAVAFSKKALGKKYAKKKGFGKGVLLSQETNETRTLCYYWVLWAQVLTGDRWRQARGRGGRRQVSMV